ncbi:MAG: DUF1015 domain-containing protein [Deltaproteobacteria bacterium]|nr:DUF1015 domain-containing protein [Deltaproteobacteria bacterium]
MLELKPFKALRYNKNKIKDYEDVLTPPYDVISEEEKKIFHKKSAYNFAHLILGNSYQEIAQDFKKFIKEKVLTEPQAEAFYFCREEYNFDGKHERFGLICLVNQGSHVIPHEKTFKKYRDDRLQVMKATHAQLSPVFGMFSEKAISLKRYWSKNLKHKVPLTKVEGHDGALEVWEVLDKSFMKMLNQKLSQKNIYIIDGHHRYAVMEEYQRLKKTKNPQVMMYVTNQEEEGLLILPTHRAVKLQESSVFKNLIQELKTGQTYSLKEGLQKIRKGETLLGYSTSKDPEKLSLIDSKTFQKGFTAPKHLRYLEKVLEKISFKTLDFIRGPEKHEVEALKKLKNHEYDIIFWASPVSWKEFFEVTKSGCVMPQKSTYFYPKILSGIAIWKLAQ